MLQDILNEYEPYLDDNTSEDRDDGIVPHDEFDYKSLFQDIMKDLSKLEAVK